MKKISLDGLEGKSLELATQNNEIVDKLIALEQKGVDVTGLETRLKAVEGIEQKKYDTEIAELKTIIDGLETKIKPITEVKTLSLRDQIVAEIKSLGVNNMKELDTYLRSNGSKVFEIKAISAIASTANTDTVGRTNLDMTIAWTPTVQNAFLGKFRTVPEGSDKSIFSYLEGTYTGAAGYVGEGVGNANSDSASAAATTGTYAKVQAVLSVNSEVYEDIPDFADGLITQMQIAASKFVDDEAYTGDGLAPAGKQHIKGLLAQSTAVGFGVGANMEAYAASVKLANAGDLVDAIKTYIDNLDGSYVADVCYMNPVDLFKLRKVKDTTGQPVIGTDQFGKPVLAGIEVRTSRKIAANTMMVLDSNVVEWRTKRAMELKLGQILTDDIINDKRSAVLMARYQLLVRTLDQKAVMKVTSISAAITSLTLA